MTAPIWKKFSAEFHQEGTEDRTYLIQALSTTKAKDNPSILVLVAGLEAQNGQLEQALNTVNRALKKRPNATGYILMKANLLNALGDTQATLQWYEKSSRKHRNNLDVRLAEVKYLVKLNEATLALKKTARHSKKMADCRRSPVYCRTDQYRPGRIRESRKISGRTALFCAVSK